MPAVPSCLLEPIWVEFCALTGGERLGFPFWPPAGVTARLHAAALRAYDLLIGLELGDVPVDGCITRAPCGGQRAGPSPAGRRKGGLKRSVATEAHGIPLGIASAPGNRHDSPLLAPTLEAAKRQLDGLLPDDRTCHLDRGYDSAPTRKLLDELGFDGAIARKGVPARPRQAPAGSWKELTPG